MDRLDAMAMFVAAVEEGSLAKAARRIGRSPASVTRGVALVEEYAGGRLLHRSTRSLTLTELGREQIVVFRNVLGCLAQNRRAQDRLGGEFSVTAPELFGRLKVLPELGRFLSHHPEVKARAILLNRMVDMVEEGIDLAVRIARLQDSSLTAVRLGTLQRLVCASPAYLERAGVPMQPSDLTRHTCIDLHVGGGSEIWRLRTKPTISSQLRAVEIGSRLSINTQAAALDMALLGNGICHSWSYQVADQLADGMLVRLLKDYEPDSVPVQFVFHATQRAGGIVRTFVDQATPTLQADLARIAQAME
jgi:DNA-binding transcriptional LysR family regulator